MTILDHDDDTTGAHGLPDPATLLLTGDSRLTNARTPTPHQHATTQVTNLPGTLDSLIEDDDPRLTDDRPPTAHSHPTGPSVGWAGEWQPNTTYDAGEVVAHEGQTWTRNVTGNDGATFVSGNWALVLPRAEDGVDGEDGATGDEGPVGDPGDPGTNSNVNGANGTGPAILPIQSYRPDNFPLTIHQEGLTVVEGQQTWRPRTVVPYGGSVVFNRNHDLTEQYVYIANGERNVKPLHPGDVDGDLTKFPWFNGVGLGAGAVLHVETAPTPGSPSRKRRIVRATNTEDLISLKYDNAAYGPLEFDVYGPPGIDALWVWSAAIQGWRSMPLSYRQFGRDREIIGLVSGLGSAYGGTEKTPLYVGQAPQYWFSGLYSNRTVNVQGTGTWSVQGVAVHEFGHAVDYNWLAPVDTRITTYPVTLDGITEQRSQISYHSVWRNFHETYIKNNPAMVAPYEYGKTNYQEWFAELFTTYFYTGLGSDRYDVEFLGTCAGDTGIRDWVIDKWTQVGLTDLTLS